MEYFVLSILDTEDAIEFMRMYIRLALFSDEPQDMFFVKKLMTALYEKDGD